MADGEVRVELIAFQLDWADPAVREKFTDDACDLCTDSLDGLRTTQLLLRPYPGGKVAETMMLCSVSCRDLAIRTREGVR